MSISDIFGASLSAAFAVGGGRLTSLYALGIVKPDENAALTKVTATADGLSGADITIKKKG